MSKNELFCFYKSDRTSDFLRIDKDGYAYFWGIHINQKRIKINKHINSLIIKYDFTKGEVMELANDNCLLFFEEVYKINASKQSFK